METSNVLLERPPNHSSVPFQLLLSQAPPACEQVEALLWPGRLNQGRNIKDALLRKTRFHQHDHPVNSNQKPHLNAHQKYFSARPSMGTD